VPKSEDYLFRSARDYSGGKVLVNMEIDYPPWISNPLSVRRGLQIRTSSGAFCINIKI